MDSKKKSYQVIKRWLRKELEFYYQEIEESGIIEHLSATRNYFLENVRGKDYRNKPYHFSGITDLNAIGIIYSLIRELKPNIIVETGVCNGCSTAFILLALSKNNQGRLYSIDLPQVEGEIYEEGTFWKKKPASVIPHSKSPGWVIPEYLKQAWVLILGKTQEKLPLLLRELNQIDFFIHDSEHSYECMWFEFEQAYNALKPGGILASDDINWNSSFYDFCKLQNKVPFKINQRMGFVVK